MSHVPTATPRLSLRFRSRAWSLAVLALGLTWGVLHPGTLRAQGGAKGATQLTPELVAVRAALDKYKDPIVAVHDGYFSSVACLAYSQGMSGHGGMDYKAGGMGVHFLNVANIGPKLDPMKPQVLLYEPVGDKLQLVAAEWFVPTQVSKEAPSIFGQALQGPMAGHEPVLPAALHHWDLHVWLWKSNPTGLFSSTNPTVKCPKTGYSFDDKPPMMVTP
jgi:hypothetical protein